MEEKIRMCEQCLCKVLVAQVKYIQIFKLFLLKTVYSGDNALLSGQLCNFLKVNKRVLKIYCLNLYVNLRAFVG